MAANGVPDHISGKDLTSLGNNDKKRKKSSPLGPDRIFVFQLLYNLCLLAYDRPEKLP